MSLVKISELPATATLLQSQEVPTNNAGVNEKVTIGQIINGNVYSITADYTGSTTDGYARIHFNHSATTKKITYLFPAVAASVGRAILFQNLDTGLSVLDGNGANIIFKNNTLTSLKLIMKSDICIARSNGTVWVVEHCYISELTGFIARNDWAAVDFSSAFTYDTKSASIDFTGQHISGTNNAALVVYDSGGTGASGILYLCNQSGSDGGVWANNEVVTCGSGGYTCLVNEVSGSSKNIDYNVYHALGLDQIDLDLESFYSANATWATSYRISHHPVGNASNPSFNWYEVDNNTLTYIIYTQGFNIITPAFGATAIDGEDDFFYLKISVKL
jgi:hypothetical protein